MDIDTRNPRTNQTHNTTHTHTRSTPAKSMLPPAPAGKPEQPLSHLQGRDCRANPSGCRRQREKLQSCSFAFFRSLKVNVLFDLFVCHRLFPRHGGTTEALQPNAGSCEVERCWSMEAAPPKRLQDKFQRRALIMLDQAGQRLVSFPCSYRAPCSRMAWKSFKRPSDRRRVLRQQKSCSKASVCVHICFSYKYI
jgi:hypothetical protein